VSEAGASLLDRWLRPGREGPAEIRIDLLWLLGLGLLFIGAGLGLRDPWPADEPRFVLIAQDMLRSGDWLVPRVGGDLYADKPPLFFWLLALSIGLTGSIRAGFLLPSLLAGLGTLVLVYDLLRRLHGREVAFCGALLLLATWQFTWQARQAQIDATLCFLTTLGLYGLLRHLCAGPARGWFFLGCAAAGLGVITKGVGFLPILVLLPWAWLVRRGWPSPVGRLGQDAWLAPLALLGAIALWFVPMVLHTSADPALVPYRDEILLQQTVTRYSNAWHHHEPFWYFLLQVIPALWLVAIALLPWLWPRWRQALRERRLVTGVLLAWVLIVLVFFSASSGKRGVYILPALPAFVMAAAPWLPELLRARGPRRVFFGLALALAVAASIGALWFMVDADGRARLVEHYAIDPRLPLALAGLLGLAACAVFSVRAGFAAWHAMLGIVLVTAGLLVYPRLDAVRSGRAFMERVEQATAGVGELGIVGFREQYLLQLRRPSVNFGHARWREKPQEVADATAWLAAAPDRALLIDDEAKAICFGGASAEPLGRANRDHWFLVRSGADPACIRRGDAARAIRYRPPPGPPAE
jgi:4-amino-4-deoxy-L-arabinose transferase-like glycosyltransferase